MLKSTNHDDISWVLIFKNSDIIGYVHSYLEADDFCYQNNLFWEFAHQYTKDQKKLKELYENLEQLNINYKF